MAQGHKVSLKTRLVVDLIPIRGDWNIYLNLYFHFFALVSRTSTALTSATQHAIPLEFGIRWGTECLKTWFPLPTLLCAGYSVKRFISVLQSHFVPLRYEWTLLQFLHKNNLKNHLNLLYSQIQEGQIVSDLDNRLGPLTTHRCSQTTVELDYH